MSFSCDAIHDPEIRSKLDHAERLSSRAHPLICLPNIHRKKGLESPPQLVTATNGTIVPMLTAPSVNCGVSIFTTSLSKNDFSEDFLTVFAKNLRSGIVPRLNTFLRILVWFGIRERPPMPYDISQKELESFFLNGAEAALSRYHLPQEEKSNMEYGGSMLSKEEQGQVSLRSLIPRSAWRNARHELGYNFGGNHFLEFHVVETIVDEDRARAWNISKDQIVLLYHGGGGHATYHLGRYFARREKNTRLERFKLFFLKFIFHFASFQDLQNFIPRWRAYFSHHPFPEIPLESLEGKRLFQSLTVSLNYGYAFRTALLRRIIDAMPRDTSVHFLWDAAHNSIHKEVIGEKTLVVHRHDAARVFEGKPVIIAGSNNTLSYLGQGSGGAEKTLYSYSQSAGKTIEKRIAEKTIRAEPEFVTLRSKRKNSTVESIPHISSEGLFDVTRPLEEADAIQPVAYLRPLASIKGH